MPGLTDVRVTLYDIFGYLLPGLVAFAALAIFVWAVVFPRAALDTPTLSGLEWIAVTVVAYFLGHLVQAIATWVVVKHPKLQPRGQQQLEWVPCAREIAEQLNVPSLPENPTEALKEDRAWEIYELCDIVVSQKGQTGDREIYQYREGFYRGLTVALALVLVAVVVRAGVSGDAIVGRHHVLTGGEYILTCAIVVGAAYLAWQRFLQFFALKWHNALWSFAVVAGLVRLPKSDS